MLDHQSACSFLNDIDTLLFDCDGVLWKGSSLIPGADQVGGAKECKYTGECGPSHDDLVLITSKIHREGAWVPCNGNISSTIII